MKSRIYNILRGYMMYTSSRVLDQRDFLFKFFATFFCCFSSLSNKAKLSPAMKCAIFDDFVIKKRAIYDSYHITFGLAKYQPLREIFKASIS